MLLLHVLMLLLLVLSVRRMDGGDSKRHVGVVMKKVLSLLLVCIVFGFSWTSISGVLRVGVCAVSVGGDWIWLLSCLLFMFLFMFLSEW